MTDKSPLLDAPETADCSSATCSTFAEHREQTAKDCEQIAEMITKLAADVREGNLKAFEVFWWEGGTEEGDAKICALREMLLLRYTFREESIESNVKVHTPLPARADDETEVKP